MKQTKQKLLPLLALVTVAYSGASQAVLEDKGYGLIYDTELDVTWLQDANYAKTSGHDADGRMNWSAANAWAAGLSYDGGKYGIIDDWRLADVKPVNHTAFQYSYSPAGDTDIGFNITSKQSELSYMFYQNLGNAGYRDTAGNITGCAGPDYCLTNTGLFDNLESYVYWSAVEYAPSTDGAWAFSTDYGSQGSLLKHNEFYVWAVRSGDVTVVPVPAAVWFMGSALLGLTGFARKR